MSMRNLIGRLEEGGSPNIIHRPKTMWMNNHEYLYRYARNLQSIGRFGDTLMEIAKKVKDDDMVLLTKDDKEKLEHISSQLGLATAGLLEKRELDRLQGIADRIKR